MFIKLFYKLVITERKGRSIFYKLNYTKLTKLEKIVDEVISDIVTDYDTNGIQ